MSRRRALAVLLVTACLLGACSERSAAPSIVIVTLDTTRADHLGAYGYFRDTSPHFDALAEESILFERAIVPMATTLPTHVSLFTATYPIEHGVLANLLHGGRRFVPAPKLRSFAEVARDAGYATAGFVSASPLKSDSGIAEGFDTFVEPAAVAYQRRAVQTSDAALAWLEELGSGPFLLWLHYYDAHWPFVPPEPYASRYHTDAQLEDYMRERRFAESAVRGTVGTEDTRQTLNAYDGELRYQDEQMGRVLNALRQRPDWDRTAVLIVGDHGEGLAQHGHAAHGGTWHEQLHAPLLLRVPGEAPRTVGHTVSVVDALPTLLGALAVPEFEAFLAQATGRDALAPGFEPDAVLSQDTGRHRIPGEPSTYRLSLTTDRWKYFRVDGAERACDQLYDVEADPFELRDVAAGHAETVERLGRELDAQLEAQRARAVETGAGGTQTTDPEVVEQLQQLGYLPQDAADPRSADGC